MSTDRMHLSKITTWFLLFPGLLFYFHCAAAQEISPGKDSDSSRLKPLFSAGAGLQRGFIFAHSPAVENTKGANPTGVELIFSWQRNDPSIWALCNCFPRKGLLLAYYNYDTKILGKSYTGAYFLEPVYKIANRSFLSFRGAAGASYLTSPFDSIANPTNRSYSTRLSAYLLIGLGAWFRWNDHWWLNTSVNYQHESNGGLKQPNKGINWPTAGVAIIYQPVTRQYTTAPRASEKFWVDEPLRWDLSLFGIAKRGINAQGESKRLLLLGTGLQVAKQVGRINNLSLGFEIYKDASLKSKLEQEGIDASPVKAGMLAGHEFILGKFLFTQRLGIYVFDQTPYFDKIYHRWGLQYSINRQAAIGFNLKAHRQVADFADLRLTYTLTGK